MNNTKLINLLRTFSKTEMKEFEKLVSSSFFNKGRNYLPFLKELKKFYPKFDDNKMTYEYIFHKIYPGKKFNKQIIWNMNSALLSMTEEFLLHVSLKKNKFIKNNQVAGELLKRKLSAYFSKKLDEMESEIDKTGIDSDYFMHKGILESRRLAYHFFEDTQHLLSSHNAKKGEYSILYFLKRISDSIGDMRSNTLMFNAHFDINIPYEFIKNINLEPLLDYAKKNKYQYAWLIEMYYCSIMTIINPDDSRYFFKLKELFEQNYNKFPKIERNDWRTQLVNYCVIRSNQSDQFRRAAFEINKFSLTEGFALEERYLSKILFIQMVRNALAIGETEWVKNFIDEFVPTLKPSYQKPMRALGLAFLYFKLKDYNKVLENLSKVKFIDTRDKLYVKSIYIRTYYELNELEILISHINSFTRFLNSNSTIAITTRTNYNRCLRILNRLVNAREKNDYEEIEAVYPLALDISLPLGNWLKEKIEQIRERKN